MTVMLICSLISQREKARNEREGGRKRRRVGRMKDMKQSTTKKESEEGEKIKGLTSQQNAIDN